MIDINYKKKCYPVPAEWDELSERQLILVVKVLFSKMEITKAKCQLLGILLGQKAWLAIPVEEKAQLLYLTEFIIEKNTLTKNLLPDYKKYYGPEDDLDNLKGKEFLFTELYYNEHIASGSIADLNKLVAVLYRPAKNNYDRHKDPDGDIREAFNSNLTEHYASKVAKWPLAVRQAILTWYTGCREAFPPRYPYVFSGSEGGDDSRYGLWSVLRDVAVKGTFGNFDATEEQYLPNIFMELNEMMREQEEVRKQMKSPS